MPDVLQTALEKLRPPNYLCNNGRHAAWFTSLLVLLMAWVARASLPFPNLQLFSAQFESILEMPPRTTSLVSKLPSEALVVDLKLAGCIIPSFPHDSLRHQWEKLRSSPPLTPAVTQAIADFVKAHPQDSKSVPAPGQGPAVQAQKANRSMGSRNSGGWAPPDPAQFLVGCNVQWTPVSGPPAQPMCARVLAGFLRSHF